MTARPHDDEKRRLTGCDAGIKSRAHEQGRVAHSGLGRVLTAFARVHVVEHLTEPRADLVDDRVVLSLQLLQLLERAGLCRANPPIEPLVERLHVDPVTSHDFREV